MEIRYDPYMEKDLPYRMTLEELFERSDLNEKLWVRETDLLAYIRFRGESFTCLAPASAPKNMMITPLGCMTDGRSDFIPCKVHTSGFNNVLDESDPLWPGHFSHAYKIELTPIEFNGCIERFYFSDFCSLINDGYVILQEIELDRSKLDNEFEEGVAI